MIARKIAQKRFLYFEIDFTYDCTFWSTYTFANFSYRNHTHLVDRDSEGHQTNETTYNRLMTYFTSENERSIEPKWLTKLNEKTIIVSSWYTRYVCSLPIKFNTKKTTRTFIYKMNDKQKLLTLNEDISFSHGYSSNWPSKSMEWCHFETFKRFARKPYRLLSLRHVIYSHQKLSR